MPVLRSEGEEWAEEGIKLSEGHWFKLLGLRSNNLGLSKHKMGWGNNR